MTIEATEPAEEPVEDSPIVEESQEQEPIKWDKCDKLCPAQALRFFISESGSTLGFCVHHSREVEDKLYSLGFVEVLESTEETLDSDADTEVE